MSLTELPLGLPGRIFRSAMPFGERDFSGGLFREYRDNGISLIVLLTEEEECRIRTGFDLKKFYRDNGIQVLHLPIRDFGTPSMEEVEALIPEILENASKGHHLVIHCFAGIGRTGLIAACLAKRVFGISGDEAILWVRRFIPGAVESGEQRDMVRNFGEK